MTPASRKKLLAPRFFLFAGILMGLFWCWIAFREYGYYLLPYARRPLDPRHSWLRSSGPLGLEFGALSAALILINLTYLIRKRLLHIAWLGELRSWMAFHVFTGLTAAALVLLHSGFLLRSSMGGLSFLAIMVVIATGLMGRYIYAHTPRSVEGVELGLDELRRSLESHRSALESLGMPAEFFREVFTIPDVRAKEASLFSALRALIVGNRAMKTDYARLRRMLASTPGLVAAAPRILPLATNYFQELQWLDRYFELRALMSGWRFYHRWMAIVLLAAVASHILIAISVGHIRLDHIWLPHVP